MKNLSQVDSNKEDLITFVDSEIVNFFQAKINPNLTPEQIRIIVDSLNPAPEPIYGKIINLLYLKDENNLDAIVIESKYFDQIFIITANSDMDSDHKILEINNLNQFKNRLLEAFNNQLMVSVSYENQQILSLAIINSPLQYHTWCFLPTGCPRRR